MRQFLDWFNRDATEPAIVKAGLAHLWFVTVHPFDDGNGRIGRALGDLWLARADGSSRHCYSLSAQIQRDRTVYYSIVERTHKGTLDVTEWLLWFLGALQRAISHADSTVDTVLTKDSGKLTTRKWALITQSSQDTALRDINELLELGALLRSDSGGRSKSYELVQP
jgi:Fic family protein